MFRMYKKQYFVQYVIELGRCMLGVISQISKSHAVDHFLRLLAERIERAILF